jgi:hypothetical protein
LLLKPLPVLSAGAVSGQKISILFVSRVEASRRTSGIVREVRKGVTKGLGGARYEAEAEKVSSSFQVLLNPTLTYGKGRTW